MVQQQDVKPLPQPTAPAPVKTNLCVWCLRSLNNTRRHPIPEGHERNEIMARIHPREIPPGGLLCYACWVSARRNVQRAAKLDAGINRRNITCVVCGTLLFRRKIHALPSSTGPERAEVASRIYPREIPEYAHLCATCWTEISTVVQDPEHNVSIQPPRATTMKLDGFVHTTSSSSHCFVPSCSNTERLSVPFYLRKRILTTQKIFVTNNARICNEHKSVLDWDFLDQHEFSNEFTKSEIEAMLTLSISQVDQ